MSIERMTLRQQRWLLTAIALFLLGFSVATALDVPSGFRAFLNFEGWEVPVVAVAFLVPLPIFIYFIVGIRGLGKEDR